MFARGRPTVQWNVQIAIQDYKSPRAVAVICSTLQVDITGSLFYFILFIYLFICIGPHIGPYTINNPNTVINPTVGCYYFISRQPQG